MSERDEETCSLNLRTFRRKTRNALYERKAQTRKSICRQVDEIVANHLELEKEARALEARRGEVVHNISWVWNPDRPLRLPTRRARSR